MQIKELKEASAISRFLSKIVIAESGCWEWQASKTEQGYGRFRYNGHIIRAHRFLYEKINNITIPDGLVIDHICRNTKCVNPTHLEVVTRLINNMRRVITVLDGQNQRNKTHCPKGHPYDAVNTYVHPQRHTRDCRVCRKEANKRWEAKIRLQNQSKA